MIIPTLNEAARLPLLLAAIAQEKSLTAYVQNPPLISSSRRFVGRHAMAIVCGRFVIRALFWLNVLAGPAGSYYKSNRQ